MDLRFWKKKTATEAVELNKSAGTSSKVPINNKNFKNFLVKAVGLIAKQGSGRENFEYPEYDLEEIKLASLSDSYIKQSFMKYSYLIYKAGYSLKSENEAATEYIKQRFRIMSFATEKPFDILMQEVADDLIKYSNSFLVKSRAPVNFGGIKATGVFGQHPVAGYFRIDPTTIQVKRDDYGKITGYMQSVNGKEKKYKKEDVIHFYLDKDPNNNFGTPRIIAALEDVKLLRKIEGNVISLIYRFAIPIYQWMIGTTENGMQATDREIEEARAEIEKLALDGNIVTNERTNIKAIGAEGHALDASGYLAYFEQRVFTALGVSASQMGRGGAKQDADSMEAQAHDTVKYVQRTLSIFIENFMLNELLLEGGFNPIVNEQDIVRYEFEETSLETKVKVENHEILKYQSNIKSLEETRRQLGLKEEVDEERLFANLITKQTALEQIEKQGEVTIDVDNNAFEHEKKMAEEQAKLNAQTTANVAKANQGDSPADKSAGVKGNGKTTTAKANGDVTNRNRPTNQYGTTSAKIKESQTALKKPVRRKESETKKVFQTVYKKWEDARNDISRGEDPDILLGVLKDNLVSEISKQMQLASQEGKERAFKEAKIEDVHLGAYKVSTSQLDEHVNKTVTKLLKDVRSRIKDEDAEVVFDTLSYRLRFLLEYAVPKTYWLSYATIFRELGYDNLHVDFKDSKDKEKHPSVIDLKRIDWLNVPAFHPFCDCTLTPKKAGDNK